MLFNHSIIPFQQLSCGFKLQRSIAPNMNITKPIINDENGSIQISIPSLDHLKLVMTLCNIKNLYYFNLWSHNAKYLMRKERATGNCITCFAHQTRKFSISTAHITNCQYNCNSFFKVEMITSSFDIIYLKNKSSFSITIGWSTNVPLTRF